MTRYAINEIFYSLQGEGVRAGTANVFVRFAGCNLECQMEPGPKSPGGWDCDTEFAGSLMMTAHEILAEMDRVALGAVGECRQAILTGGEPGLQVTQGLLDELKAQGWYVAIETNGSGSLNHLTGLDWVTCSPKVAEHAVRVERAHEIKYVRHAGQALPKPRCKADHYLLSPAATATEIDRAALAWCISLVKEHPEWRLSMQQHKIWRVR